MINVWEHTNARQEALHFLDRHGIEEATVLLDPEGDYISSLGLRGVPMNVVVDESGVVRAVGMTTPDEVRATLSGLLMGADS